ncbi:MAG: hypothetical protein HQM14_19940 [SAR324 cluster bacterium]|nr:hypothetical protein [SAR324 cluster bacterium]
MIFHPWILGLILTQITLFMAYSLGVFHAWTIYQGWHFESCTEQQYMLEKKTYLVSTVMNFTLFLQILMLFMLILTADDLSHVLPGAMCATGTFSANSYGFPLLILKIAAAFLYFFWLVINYLDNQLETYPLIRLKYSILILLFPLILLEVGLLFAFALNLDPSVITSCCGSLFSETESGIGSAMAGLPPHIILPLFFGVIFLLILLNFPFHACNHQKNRSKLLLESASWMFFFIFAILLIISFISPYIYEMPAHKCPFDFIRGEYHYIGIPIYFSLFVASAAGMAKGLLECLRRSKQLTEYILVLQQTFHKTAFGGMLIFLFFSFLPFVLYYGKTGRLL